MKKCTKCKEELPFERFSKNRAQKDGFSNYCKLCDNARKDPVKRAEYNRQYWKNLPEEKYSKIRTDNQKCCNKYRELNPHKFAAREACKRATKLKATPKWSNKDIVKDYYFRASAWTKLTGEAWHVDHIVPLNSNIVCGLHCEANLRIIPASENLIKGNRWWPDMPS